MATLWLSHGDTRIAVRQGEMLIGRSSYCSIVIQGEQVSRQHCALHAQGNTVTLRDLSSRNGTLLNGVPVKDEQRVRPGDTITVGGVHLVLEELSADGPRRRDTNPLAATAELFEPEASTVTTTTTTIDLVEALVEEGVLPESGAIRKAVQRSVIDLLRSPLGLSLKHRERLLVLLQRLSDSSEDTEFRHWVEETRSGLEKRS